MCALFFNGMVGGLYRITRLTFKIKKEAYIAVLRLISRCILNTAFKLTIGLYSLNQSKAIDGIDAQGAVLM